ncbi:hypothetical protein DERF_001632 [Dermatophagoides farinae]|uniref:Uncharacterized protein n=1 Tax=Dermatophagoides farinae TaxID=6954 RepID=A0A922IE37_DERFA|nr:hypothetical protein DERF_001632 [Dermatophagoides farinae]
MGATIEDQYPLQCIAFDVQLRQHEDFPLQPGTPVLCILDRCCRTCKAKNHTGSVLDRRNDILQKQY